MFEPFVRVGGRGRSHGSGIGLFAARRIMGTLGGRIFLERNGYATSRFAVAWPLTLRPPIPCPPGLDTARSDAYISHIDIATIGVTKTDDRPMTTTGHPAAITGHPAATKATTAATEATEAATEATTAGIRSGDGSTVWPVGEIPRDIARGGIAGAIVGIVVAGLGGRIVMRLAALVVPGATGALTENGNRIGDITLGGSLGLVVFAGLFFGVFAGTVWVVVSPWIPGVGLARAILTMPIAVALGTLGLIRSENRDFGALGHDPTVLAMLTALIALFGLTIALVDGWLDRRLPHATSARTGAASLYAIVTLLGAVLVLPIVVAGYFAPELRWVGIALVVIGLSTVRWWVLRFQGHPRPPTILTIAGRTALLAAVVLGFAAAVPEISGALGMT